MLASRTSSIPSSSPLKPFEQCNSLHGDRTTYGRILVPALFPHVDRLIYLDADTIPNLDLAELTRMDLEGAGVAAVVEETVTRALQRDFYLSAGLELDTPLFNAGVMLIDVARWNSEQMCERVIDGARRYAGKYRSASQPPLNAVIAGRFCPLPPRYNTQVSPRNEVVYDPASEAIYHFVGSPKPWDLGGADHPNAAIMYHALDALGLPHDIVEASWSTRSFGRFLRGLLRRAFGR